MVPEPNISHWMIAFFAGIGMCWFVRRIVWPIAKKIILTIHKWSDQ